jgi:hypothetical protein
VLQAVRKRSSKSQAEVAAGIKPPLSVAAVSMAESGNRPLKTEAMIREYAAALELDDDGMVELWWAMQGLVGVEDWEHESTQRSWWGELRPSLEAEMGHDRAEKLAKERWTPNEEFQAPRLRTFALADEVCDILRRVLGDSWDVSYRAEVDFHDPIERRRPQIFIELRWASSEGSETSSPTQLLATFPCPEPVSRPSARHGMARPQSGTLSPDVTWILDSVVAMPARDRAAVAGFIHGLREGSKLFTEPSEGS